MAIQTYKVFSGWLRSAPLAMRDKKRRAEARLGNCCASSLRRHKADLLDDCTPLGTQREG